MERPALDMQQGGDACVRGAVAWGGGLGTGKGEQSRPTAWTAEREGPREGSEPWGVGFEPRLGQLKRQMLLRGTTRVAPGTEKPLGTSGWEMLMSAPECEEKSRLHGPGQPAAHGRVLVTKQVPTAG